MKKAAPVAILFLLLLSPMPAGAYLDPGSGSYFLQIAAAALFSSLFFIKANWLAVKAFFSKSFRKPSSNGEKSNNKNNDT